MSQFQPMMPVSPLARAKQLRATGDLEGAIAELRRVVAQHPSHMPSAHMLAITCFQAGLHADALDAIHDAIMLAPQHPQVHADHGKILHALEQHDEAEEALREALRLKPGFTYAVSSLLNLLRLTGRYEEATKLADETLAQDPDDPKILLELGRCAHKVGRSDELIERIGDRIDHGLDEALVADACFVVADLHDKQKNYEQAWSWYERANRAVFQGFDADAHAKEADALIRAWQPNRIPLIPRAASGTDLPIFIVGMPRSGTSLVEQILSSHPAVHACGELKDMARIARRFRGPSQTFVPMLTEPEKLTAELLDAGQAEYLDRLRRDAPDAQRVTDKMPENGFYLGLISRMLPGARIVRCKRNPMDVALSCYFHDFASKIMWIYDPESLASFYRDNERVIDRFAESLDIAVLDVVYEEMVADPEIQIRRLIDFAGLEWNDACLEFHRSDRVVTTSSNEQVRQPIYKSAVARHERYGPLADPLRNALRAQGLIG